MQDKSSHCRSFATWVDRPQGVWVYWSCEGRDGISRVGDLSRGGPFLETQERKSMGLKVALHSLVPEVQIRADAVGRHVQPDRGLGFKFIAPGSEGRAHLEIPGGVFVNILSARMLRERRWALPRRSKNGNDRTQTRVHGGFVAHTRSSFFPGRIDRGLICCHSAASVRVVRNSCNDCRTENELQ